METYGLPLAIDMARVTSESRDKKAEKELEDFFRIVKDCVQAAAADAKTYTDIYFYINDYEIIDIETSITIKKVFEQQGYSVDIVRDTCGYDKQVSIIVKVSW